MQETLKTAKQLFAGISYAIENLQIAKAESHLLELNAKTADPALWQDQTRAQALMKEQSDLEQKVQKWRVIESSAKDIVELAESEDESLLKDLDKQLSKLQKTFAKYKTDLLFSGPFDDHQAIVSIHAGAGGTDAKYWAQMLHRMYVRYVEKEGVKVNKIDESVGERSGQKSTTIRGKFP